MPKIPVADGLALHCAVDDYLWPWQEPTPVVMLHGFARNARFWNRWVPAIAETRRVYRPELLGCGESDVPPADYRFTPQGIAAQVIATLDALSLARVHWGRRVLGRDRRPVAVGRPQPHRLRTAAGAGRQAAAWPARTVRGLWSWRQPVAAGTLRPRFPRFLAGARVGLIGNSRPHRCRSKA